MYFLNKLFTVPEEVGVEKVWYDDTDPAAEIVAKYLDHDQTLGVGKGLTARFLLPLMEMKAATGFGGGQDPRRQGCRGAGTDARLF